MQYTNPITMARPRWRSRGLQARKGRKNRVDINLTEDQRMLLESTGKFAGDRASIQQFRRIADRRAEFGRADWQEGAAQGWVALFTPEAHGGIAESSQGLIDAAIVAETLGRVVYPGPFLSSCVVAAAITAAGSDAQQAQFLPGIAAGEILAAWAYAAPGPRGGIAPGSVSATQAGNTFTLNGTAAYVQDATDSDLLLVSAASDSGHSQFLLPSKAPGISIEPLETLDLGRKIANVKFSAVQAGPETLLGNFAAATAAFERQLQIALVLQSAETLGVIERALEITLEYTGQRIAFGRPVASFQGVKHRLADYATQLEGGKAAVAHAARAVQSNAPDAAIAASIAASHCGRWGTDIVRDCMHLHGGIGVTWDHDMHFYLRRAVSNEALYGAPLVHHGRLAALAGL